MKVCTKCKLEKSEDSFYSRMACCKVCHNKRTSAWRQQNPDKARTYVDKYRLKPENKARLLSATLKWQAANPDKVKISKLRHDLKRYGLAVAEYQHLLDQQQGCCAICGDNPPRLHVDHDHTTQTVRALLCHGCNTAIGLLKESPAILSKAIEYLNRHSATMDHLGSNPAE